MERRTLHCGSLLDRDATSHVASTAFIATGCPAGKTMALPTGLSLVLLIASASIAAGQLPTGILNAGESLGQVTNLLH